jgi:hypothetical protein
MPVRIVSHAYRPKRPPRKRKAAPGRPAIVRNAKCGSETRPEAELLPNAGKKPTIVTTRRRGSGMPDVPDMTTEEFQRRVDAADALWANWCAGRPARIGHDRQGGPATPLAQQWAAIRLPTGEEAVDQPFNAFPSWFLRVECDRCGKLQLVNQVHFGRSDMLLRVILDKMRHDGCGGPPGKAELITGIEGVSSRPVRRIALRL